MIPIPAIDIREGRCVRLLRGDFSAETVYGDPIVQALAFVEQGAPMLHIVDLDAARTGEPVNQALVQEIVRRSAVAVQFGGGVRDAKSAERLLGEGIERVVIGTLAVEDSVAVMRLAEHFPDRVVLGFDYKVEDTSSGSRRVIAVRGWESSGGIELDQALSTFAGVPVAGAVVTDISRDGTLLGPDIGGYSHVLSVSAIPLVASGGVGSLADVLALRNLEVSGRSISGVIIGRALLAGAFSVAEVVGACAP